MMKVILVRHGTASDAAAWEESGKPDEFRPLSEEGKSKCRQSFGALKASIETLDTISTSPYSRAIETAEILARAFPDARAATNPLLKPDSNPDEMIAWLARRAPEKTIALVCHEPYINGLIGRMCGVRDDSVSEIKEGRCAFVEFDGKPRSSQGTLVWVNTPKKS